MGKRKSVPEDLMGNILSERLDADERPAQEPGGSVAGVSGDEGRERVGITFNLPKQLGAELEWLRTELGGEDARPSRSEIAETALRMVVEDVRQRGEGSELARRIHERRAGRGSARVTTRRSVDDDGTIFESTHDENGEILDEDVVGSVTDLPIVDEYVDAQGRLVSVAKDELGNTFEQLMDEGYNLLGVRLLTTQGEQQAD